MCAERARWSSDKLRGESLFHCGVFAAWDVHVNAEVVRLATDRLHMGKHLAHALAAEGTLADEEVKDEEVGEDAVALREVHREAIASRLLATHGGARLNHLRPHVLEADWRLKHLSAIVRAESLAHGALVDRLHDRSQILLMFKHVIREEPKRLQLMDKDALLGHRTRAISIAVKKESQVVTAATHRIQHRINVRPNRLRIYATKPRVALTAHLRDAQLPACEQPADPASARAVDRVDHDAEWLCRESRKVKVALHELLVARVRVVAFHQASRLRVGERSAAQLWSTRLRDLRLDALQQFGPRRGT